MVGLSILLIVINDIILNATKYFDNEVGVRVNTKQKKKKSSTTVHNHHNNLNNE